MAKRYQQYKTGKRKYRHGQRYHYCSVPIKDKKFEKELKEVGLGVPMITVRARRPVGNVLTPAQVKDTKRRNELLAQQLEAKRKMDSADPVARMEKFTVDTRDFQGEEPIFTATKGGLSRTKTRGFKIERESDFKLLDPKAEEMRRKSIDSVRSAEARQMAKEAKLRRELGF